MLATLGKLKTSMDSFMIVMEMSLITVSLMTPSSTKVLPIRLEDPSELLLNRGFVGNSIMLMFGICVAVMSEAVA
jgi:hypothetical protein